MPKGHYERRSRPLSERWSAKVRKTDGCWIWIGAINPNGYGRMGEGWAHRIAYELHVDAIPDGMEIDHLCSNVLCVRPDHLEAVTPKVNSERRAARTTHCPKGHPYDEANTYQYGSNRKCRACRREHRAAYKKRQRTASVTAAPLSL